MASAARANATRPSVRLTCGLRARVGTAASTAHARATTISASPASEWPLTWRSPAYRKAAPSESVNALPAMIDASQPTEVRVDRVSSSAKVTAMNSAATIAVAMTAEVKPWCACDTASSTSVSAKPIAHSAATNVRHRKRRKSGSAAAIMTAANSTPPAVTSWLTTTGATMAADIPNTASGSCLIRMARPTAIAAISAESGAAAGAEIR